ncbi:MAG: 50S ribosome-binding GTPase, partial [Deltaproteobacteria bacterium]|nr:50S ribosome-binding GTPase [Deltaproteobacteria bacterium]
RNAGKSSVFNALLGYPRAIICEEPGTTRDFISESLYFEDFFVSVIDTAGIRKTGDFVESEGVSRSKRLIDESPLAIAVFDSSGDFDENDLHLLSILKRDSTLFVLNKTDIEGGKPRSFPDLEGLNPLRISALRGDGIEDLRAAVARRIRDSLSPSESPFMINERQYDVLKRLAECLNRFIQAVKQKEPAEISAEEIRRAVSITNEITGDDISEEILERIFSRFCVGK